MAADTELSSGLRERDELVDTRKESKPDHRRSWKRRLLRAEVATGEDYASKRLTNKMLLPCSFHGSASIFGRRKEMQDTVTVAPEFASAVAGFGVLEPAAYEFYGVYDRNGRAGVASACRDRLHVVLAEEVTAAGGGWPRGEEQWREVMAASFSRVDGELLAAEGLTAVVAVVGKDRIVMANCGDSRAVLSRGGAAVPLSSNHKPDRLDEKKRVEAAGGTVINWDVHRVSRVLATSRSIGDHYLKPFVTSEPEVTVTSRTEEDEFLIPASDGPWDVVPNEVACKVARQCLNGQKARKLPDVISE